MPAYLERGVSIKISYLMMESSIGAIFCVTGPLCREFNDEFPSQRPLTRSFDVFFDLRLNKRLCTQPEVRNLGRHRAYHDVNVMFSMTPICLVFIAEGPAALENLWVWKTSLRNGALYLN